PNAFVIVMGPLVAPPGTADRIWVPFWPVTVNPAFTPLNFKTVGPLLKFTPVIVTGVPGGPSTGANHSTIGAWVLTKSLLLVPTPKLLVPVMRPLAAALGTVTRLCLGDGCEMPRPTLL